MKTTCFFKGHKQTGVNDSGYGVCDRCGDHEYYQWENFERTIPAFWNTVKHKVKTTWQLLTRKKTDIPF